MAELQSPESPDSSESEDSKVKLCRKDIEALVEEPYFSRGEDYFNNGMVEIGSVGDFEVDAEVFGTKRYQVILRHDGNSLDGECSCPTFKSHGPCKHMAATGLALVKSDQWGYIPSERRRARINQKNCFKKLLLGKTKRQLIEMMVNNKGMFAELRREYKRYGRFL